MQQHQKHAATILQYIYKSLSFKIFTTLAIRWSFLTYCYINTKYIIILFDLIIASIAIAVLPVCLSPIINSRWPRPIGTLLSTAFIPVSTGSLTGFLAIIPGAFTSIFTLYHLIIVTFPSIASQLILKYDLKHSYPFLIFGCL